MIDLNSEPPKRAKEVGHAKAKKLTPEKVANIKAARARGFTQAYCAAHFGVSQGCISQITRGVIWTDIVAEKATSLAEAKQVTLDELMELRAALPPYKHVYVAPIDVEQVFAEHAKAREAAK